MANIYLCNWFWLILIWRFGFVLSAFPLSEFVPPLGIISVYSGSNKSELLEQIQEQPTRFSFKDDSDNIEGYVFSSFPVNACKDVSPPPVLGDEEETVKWILLVSTNSGCTFEKKLRNAKYAGYMAVIIHNIHSNETEAIPKSKTLPAYFIGESDGSSIRDKHSYPSYHYIAIERPDLFWGKFRAYGVWISTLVAVLAVGTGSIYFGVRFKKFSVRWGNNCGVCREPLPRSDGNSLLARLYVLPCSHKFHAFCMMPYSSPTGMCCPICSRTFNFDSHSSNSGDEHGQSNAGGSSGESIDPKSLLSNSPYLTPTPQPTVERTRIELHDEAGSGMISSAIEIIHGTPTRIELDPERQPLLSTNNEISRD